MNKKIFRKDKIIEMCKNKNVLHLGFVQHDMWKEKHRKNEWLHSKINDVAKKLVGIDYLKNEVEEIKKVFEYDVYFGDVMKLDDLKIYNKFDVIVCTELIEHIENPGQMLDGVKRFMKDDSIIIITTPNPWRSLLIHNINNNILENQWLNKEHVSWFSYQTLKQLLERKNFKEVSYSYYFKEDENEYMKTTKLKRSLRSLKSLITFKYIEKNTHIQNYEGLFFVAKI